MTTVSQVQVHANPKAAWELIGVLESEVSERDATIAAQSARIAELEELESGHQKYIDIIVAASEKDHTAYEAQSAALVLAERERDEALFTLEEVNDALKEWFGPERAVDAEEGALKVEEDMKEAARTLLTARAAARADALTMVARARRRGGRPADVWSSIDAEIAFNIADMLRSVQGQLAAPGDPAFDAHETDIRQLAASAEIEFTLRAAVAPPPEPEGRKTPVSSFVLVVPGASEITGRGATVLSGLATYVVTAKGLLLKGPTEHVDELLPQVDSFQFFSTMRAAGRDTNSNRDVIATLREWLADDQRHELPSDDAAS